MANAYPDGQTLVNQPVCQKGAAIQPAAKSGLGFKELLASPESVKAADRAAVWPEIKKLFPVKRTRAERRLRIALFRLFDFDNDNSLSEEEVLDGCINILHLEPFTSRLPVIVRIAFNQAKVVGSKQKVATGTADLVEYLEFRLLLSHIYYYFELWVMFDKFNTNGPLLMDKKEFLAAVPALRDYGLEIADPEATFRSIDVNQSNTLTLDEFLTWGAKLKLNLEDDLDMVQ